MPTDKVLENFRRADFEEFWSYNLATIVSVVAGEPGYFVGPGTTTPTAPANITALRAEENVGTTAMAGTDAWTTDQYVVIGTGNVHWNGTDWATGKAA